MTRSEIIAALKEAKGPVRELDSRIISATTGAETWSYHENCHIDTQIEKGIWNGAREDHPDFIPGGDLDLTYRYRIDASTEYGEVPELTRSIDAAIALVERVRPGWNWGVLKTESDGPGALLAKSENSRGYEVFAATPAIALVLALLQSMEAEGK